MDLRELENYRLSDAVKFNDQLNPRLWGSDEHLLPEVRNKLRAIADDFRESLGIDVEVKDITISGSNAAYTYTPHSDIDLHLVVDLPKADASDVYRELFDAKKYQYNDQHDYKIGGYDVELYVQDARKPHHSQGIYSLMHNDWVRVPSRRKPEVDDISVKSKYEDIGQRIDAAIESGDLARMDAMAAKIREMRQAGLDAHGEFGPENLAFKVLRGNGTLERLRNARKSVQDQEMSLQERKKRRKNTRYGFGGYWYPGFNYGDTAGEAGGDGGGESQNEDYDPNDEPPGPEFKPEMPAGTILVNVSDVYDWYKLGQDISDLKHADPKAYGKGAPQTVLSFGSEPLEHEYKQDLDRLGMKTLDIDRRAKNKDPESAYRMDEQDDVESRLRDFVAFTAQQLDIDHLPRIRFKRDPAWSRRNNTFGRYVPDDHTLYVSLADRHPLDIMRTIAHELTHHRQSEQEHIPDTAGETGSNYENEANALAGIIMRRYTDLHPGHFDLSRDLVDEGLRSQLGALATAACVAGSPGCATTGSDVLRGVQDVGRTAQTFKGYTKQDAKAEFQQAIQNWLASGRQGPQPKPPQELVNQWKQEVRGVMAREAIQTPVAKDDRDKDSYYKFIMGKASAGRPLTRQEQEFIKTYRLAQQMRAQVAEASGYIPTRAQARDPRFSTALTVDIKPGQTGKEANKLGLKTDSQGRPQLLMKKLANLLEAVKLDEKCWDGYRQAGMKEKGDRQVPNCVPVEEDQDLFEVKMSPGELEKWANSEEAEGIQAGFEAELIFRDTSRDDDEGESEPDMDADQRADSIESVLEFFMGGDMGIGRNTANRVRDRLYEELYDWQMEQIDREWEDEAEDQVRDWMRNNISPDEYRDQAVEELGIDGDATEEQLAAIDQRAAELFNQAIDSAIENQDDNYDRARDEFYDYRRDDTDYDEESFLSDRYRYMSDIGDAFSLDWPYWTEGSSGNSGSRTTEEIADSLSSELGGAEVRASSGYHSTSRKPGRWIIEPDGSLDPDEYEDAGLEVVSPPMPLPEALRSLRTVIDWANSDGDAYTNGSTGLHMGVSIPHKGGDVDYVKLILFLGDRYVLDQFGRSANSYTRSALDKLQDVQRSRRSTNEAEGLTGAEKTAAAMELMKRNLIELAQRYVQDGVGRDKYTSAHTKDGYIEFRSPGGDYLSMDSRDESALANTMLRFARAMYIAGRPDLERKEYAKKLYQLIDTQGDDALKLFMDYTTGQINQEELKKNWARQVLAKEQPRKAAPDAELPPPEKKLSRRAEIARKISDRPTVWHITNTNTNKTLLVAAQNTDDARNVARRQDQEFNNLYLNDPDSFVVRPATAEEIKQYQAQAQDNAQDRQDIEQRVTRSSGEQRYRVSWTERRDGRDITDSLGVTARNADAAMASVRSALEAQGRRPITISADPASVEGSTLDRDLAARAQQAAGNDQPTGDWIDQLGRELRQQAGTWTGHWIVQDGQGRELTRFHGIGNNQSDANRHAARWLGTNRPDLAGQEIEVVPEIR